MTNGFGQFNNDRERVLDATDIVQLVGEHLTVHPKGREYVALCPFHDDHKPSMYVVPHKQIYHCFSCGAGGNAIDFVINYHKMGFREALQFLADRAGVELTPLRTRTPDDAQGPESPATSKSDLAAANASALGFFRAILAHPEHGASAREAIAARGVSDEMAELFELGAAPDRWDGLLITAQSKNIPLSALHETGLLKRRPSGDGAYDAFRNRLIFPIHDQIGRPVAFGGRVLGEAGEGEPKYLNSPESRLFDKSSTLYGLRQAFRDIQNERLAIVTEGYTDVIACHQAGIRNVVATLGTALTTRHATLLKRLCDVVVLLFDGDEAGMKAADRAVEVFFAEPIDVRIAVLPGGADPDDLLKEDDGAERFRAMVDEAVDALDYRFRRLAGRLEGVSPSGRVRLIEEDIQRLVELGLLQTSPIRRRLITRKLATLAGVDEQTIISAIPTQRRARHEGAPVEGDESAHRSPIEHALGCLLCEPELRLIIGPAERDLLQPGAYRQGPSREVAEAFETVIRKSESDESGRTPTLAGVLAELEDAEARRLATELALESERSTDHDAARLREHFLSCVRSAEIELDRRTQTTQELSDESDVLAARLKKRREMHSRHGGDPLAIPRPAPLSSPRAGE